MDHLGRGQIADAPTAIGELWKNAFDAYARDVSLHIYGGVLKTAAILDTGHGMTLDEFVGRWLVLGTETKLDEPTVLAVERFGLPERPRQGEKGIGRLSVAFLAPVTVVISKRQNHDMVVAVIDWRLFENPFLALSDLRIPVEEVKSSQELLERLPVMVRALKENLTGEDGPEIRRERLTDGWLRFDEYEKKHHVSPTTAKSIRTFSEQGFLDEKHLDEWEVTAGLSDHGTALYMIDIRRELAVWVDPDLNPEDDEVQEVRQRLYQTLRGFTDSYTDAPQDFLYEVWTHGDLGGHRILASTECFDIEELRNLEHNIEGEFDKNGWFSGVVTVFGKDRGEFSVAPRRVPPKAGRDMVGPFSLCLGSFEQTPSKTTHPPEVYVALGEKADRFAGLGVFRDGLRVMPYGRPDNDFFGIESRRTRHAGREFWVHHRTFGRVALQRHRNPNLRDKAGREGFIENRALREMRLLVTNVLRDVALRFFGTDSDIRQEELPEIQARYAAGKRAQELARKRRGQGFRKFLRENKKDMSLALLEVQGANVRVASYGDAPSSEDLAVELDLVERFLERRNELRLPPLPKKLKSVEADYRAYRDQYREFCASVDAMKARLAAFEQLVAQEPPTDVARRRLHSNQTKLNHQIGRYVKELNGRLDELRERWRARAEADRKRFYKQSAPLLDDIDKDVRLGRVLNLLDANRQEVEQQLIEFYEPTMRALDHLLDDIDIDSALAVTEDERLELEEKLSQFHALAQLGISVEIIGHELETLDTEVGRNLKRLPKDVQKREAFKLAYEAHRALVDRLRFLYPMKLSGYRLRRKITGDEIAEYVEEYFRARFRDARISFIATEEFRGLSISDLPARIFPVFINLVNNSLYWLQSADERRIVFDYFRGLVAISDSGPGVDPDDIPHLFELFFTRRAMGRGVGLYLCRANLAVANHTIRYAGDNDPKPLDGATLIIEFKGVSNV